MLNLIKNGPWVSLTGLYTAHVWRLHGLAPDSTDTWLGKAARMAMLPFEQVSEALWGTSLESTLIARHQAMDKWSVDWLNTHSNDGPLAFVELPCGLATRARRLASQYARKPVVWIEADLPAMMAARHELLGTSPHVQGLVVDALKEDGLSGMNRLTDKTGAQKHICVTMEGLLNYLGESGIRRALSLQRRLLKPGQTLTLIADIWPDLPNQPLGAFRHVPARILKLLTGSQAGLAGRSVEEIRGWFVEAGFDDVSLVTLDGKPFESMSESPAPWCILVVAHAGHHPG